jgi:hypothetical protein
MLSCKSDQCRIFRKPQYSFVDAHCTDFSSVIGPQIGQHIIWQTTMTELVNGGLIFGRWSGFPPRLKT